MKILLLNDDFTGLKDTAFDGEPRGRGGAAIVVASLAEEYARAGHTVEVLTTHQSDPQSIVEERTSHVCVTSLPIRYPKRLRHYLTLWNPKASRLISAFLKANGPFDAVHVHNVHSFITYNAIPLVRQYSRNVIITFHDAMSVAYGRIGTPQYLEKNDPHLTILDHVRLAGRSYNPLRNSIIRRMLRSATTKISVSRALREALEKNGVVVDAVIHNGITALDGDALEKRTQELRRMWNVEGKSVLFLGGRLRKEKGVLHAFEALRMVRETHPNTVLLLVGARSDAEVLLRNYPHADVIQSYIIITDWIPQSDVRAALWLSDICLTPSVYLDPFVLVNVEAMSAGKPVIGTRFGGTHEIVENGKTGFIIDPRNAGEFAKAITKLLDDPDLRQRMGNAGRERVQKNFSLTKQVQQYLDLLSRE